MYLPAYLDVALTCDVALNIFVPSLFAATRTPLPTEVTFLAASRPDGKPYLPTCLPACLHADAM